MAPAATARQTELDKILEEVSALEKQYEGKRWPTPEREKFDRLCEEGDALQKEIASEEKARKLYENADRLRQVPEPSLPSSRNGGSKAAPSGRDVAGYLSLGDSVIASEAFQKFAREGYARGHVAVVQLATAITGKNIQYGPRGEPLVPLTVEMRKAVEAFFQTKEAKAIPSVGAGVLEVDRVARLPQVTRDERLTLRDVIATGTTNASAVEYVREDSISGAPAFVAHGQEKPEVGVTYSLQSAPVRTIAGWMPVQNQQLEDWAQLRSLIDGRLRYMIKRLEEQAILYGDGTPPNIQGILDVSGTTNIATNGRYNAGAHTLIDVVRLGITDVTVAGYEPNAVVVHPYDWETILLEKGSDNRYVWAVVTDNNGSRIWGVRAVESVGAQNRDDEVDVNRRAIVVGDWQMGAQLLDRMDLTVQVGLVDRQFIENMRTILAEERIALPIYAPAAFAYFDTVDES